MGPNMGSQEAPRNWVGLGGRVAENFTTGFALFREHLWLRLDGSGVWTHLKVAVAACIE
jgi:hypothetical protein